MKLVISHFFNEEYLLPLWLQHHREMFDHGILIDYHSTDRSVEICRDLVPDWDVVTSENQHFAALKCDFEVMQHEARHPHAWKIVLNTTEFLAGNTLDGVIEAAETAGHLGLRIPGAVMVDSQPGSPIDPSKPLITQKNHGFWESEFPVGQTHFPWFFSRARTRLLHRHAFGAYTPGRHTSMLPSLVDVSNTELGIWWYGYSPWSEEFIARKVQIQTKMDPDDKKAGFGRQHLASYEEQNTRHEALLPFAHDLDPYFSKAVCTEAATAKDQQIAVDLFNSWKQPDVNTTALAERDAAVNLLQHAQKYPWKYLGAAFRMRLGKKKKSEANHSIDPGTQGKTASLKRGGSLSHPVVQNSPVPRKRPKASHHTPLDQMVHRFVISAGRAGSTFIATSLNMHPKVCCQIESHHLPLLIDAFGGQHASPRALLAVTMQAKFHTGQVIIEHSLDRLGIGRGAFFDWQQHLIASHDQLSIHAFQTKLADFFLTETGKTIFVDKTPCYGWSIAALQNTLPRTRFVNQVRDCAPSVLSMLRHDGFVAKIRSGETNWTDVLRKHDFSAIDLKTPVKNPAEIRNMGLLWARRTDVANSQANIPPIMDLRYEDLLAHPKDFLRTFCAQIDIPFDNDWAETTAGMIKPSQTPEGVSEVDTIAQLLEMPEIRRVRSRLGYEA